MKKSTFLFPLIALLISGCSNVNPKNYQSPNLDKIAGNGDFETIGNLTAPDFAIDGKLDNPEWDDACLEIEMGHTGDGMDARVTAKVYFGDIGLTIGFHAVDDMISSSTDYNDQSFVVNSDNVEFYIDTKNDKGRVAKSDDFTFLVNPEGYTEMRTGTGSYWGPWSGVIDYAVYVEGTINDDSDYDEYWECELFLPYSTFGFTKESTVGIAFGCRDKTTNLSTSTWAGWIPDPQIIDTYVSINKNGISKSSTGDFDICAGGFRYDEENHEYIATSVNSLAVSKDLTMRNGTYSSDMFITEIAGDNGIIFQVKQNDSGLFWEGSGVRYYFFFINRDGRALLACTNNGAWRSITDSSCNYRLNDWNNLKVVVNGNNIYCFVNGTLIIEHTEALYSTIGVGIRAGDSGVKFKNINVSDSLDITSIETPSIEGYKAVAGDFSYANSEKTLVRATSNNSMIIKDGGNVTNGALEMSVNPNVAADNGLVFRVSAGDKAKYWEGIGVSYLFLFVSQAGSLYLGRTDNGNWTCVGEAPIPSFNASKTYTIKAVFEGNNISCFVDGTELVNVTDSICKGSGYGVRAGNTSAIMSLVSVL